MNYKIFLIIKLLFVFISNIPLKAQVFTGGGGPIPDNGSNNNYFNLSVAGLIPSNIDASFGVEEVCINISHPMVSDLLIFLESPDGVSVELTSLNGNSANYSNTCFSNYAATFIVNGNAPFTGLYKPEGFLGSFNNGQNGNGIWRLRIQDWKANSDAGVLLNWNVKFSNNPITPINFTSSNLPIIIINSNGQTIVDDPKVMVDMGIIYNGPGQVNFVTDPRNNYNGKAGIEFRGSSSQNYEKKSYGFKTRDILGNKLNVPLLGMPAEHDWVLYAPYLDKSLVRNFITYDLANKMGQYASRCKFVELVINGQYRGVYVLMEKIKRDKNRVDIKKMTTANVSGDELTGGYIIKIDKRNNEPDEGWFSSIGPAKAGSNDTVFFQYNHPEKDSITAEQKMYIKNYMAEFESVLISPEFSDPVTGYRKYIDVNSFVEHFIICELSKNVDAYRLSTYLYKDRDSKDGKLKIGPVWDFDLAWRNANFSDAASSVGWRYIVNDTIFPNPIWWQRLMQDESFIDNLRCKWKQFRLDILEPGIFNEFVDSLADYLDEAQQRNFTQWPVIGYNIWANPSPIPTTYKGEIQDLKDWVVDRISWMDANLSGPCYGVGINENAIVSNTFKVFPNPFDLSFTGYYEIHENTNIKLELFNSIGVRIQEVFSGEQPTGTYYQQISASHLPPGLYILKLSVGKNMYHQKIVKV